MNRVFLIIFSFLIGFTVFSDEEVKTIDLKRIRETWLSWVNEERQKLGLHSYQYDMRLEKTALTWSNISKERGYITHKRDMEDNLLYNYKAITIWFEEQGLKFKNIKGYTFTENIGYGYFKYKTGDYTDEIIKAIHSTFEYYMNEKGKTDKWESAHYRSIIAPFFYFLGLGIALDENNDCYYLTVHYGSEIEDIRKQ